MGERWQHVLLLLVLEEIWETPSFEVGTIFLSPRAPCGVRARARKRDEGRRQENIANSPLLMLSTPAPLSQPESILAHLLSRRSGQEIDNAF